MKLESLNYDHSFYRLSSGFYSRVRPEPIAQPYLIHLNPSAAELIGLKVEEQVPIELAEKKDYRELQRLLQLVSNPFEEHEGYEHYSHPPPEWASQLQVSCSS